ncbi:MAG: phosphoribosylglycinamide synthetase C domain-containing protein, partial [Pseudomonadota bacterium]
FLQGEEASFICLVDGKTALPLATSQDHKARDDGDRGPNTGGMGAYSPAPVLTADLQNQVMERIVRPTLAEMVRRGAPFSGVLYAGLMIEAGQARLVEYNVRFGDPECQALMMRLGAQVFDAMHACAVGRLPEARIDWADDHAMTVVMATEGYPGAYRKGSRIGGLEELPETSWQMMFHAGTAERDGQTVAAGGRVLSATARAEGLRDARDAAYALLDQVDWPEGTYRRDIGWRALD